MPLYVRDQTVDELVDQLVRSTHKSKTEVVREALSNEAHRLRDETLVERIKAFSAEFLAKHPKRGPPADKEFIDSLYE